MCVARPLPPPSPPLCPFALAVGATGRSMFSCFFSVSVRHCFGGGTGGGVKNSSWRFFHLQGGGTVVVFVIL